MHSYFSRVYGTLGADGDALGVGKNTLGSEAGGWTGACRGIGHSTEQSRVGVDSVGGTSAIFDEGRVGWAHS